MPATVNLKTLMAHFAATSVHDLDGIPGLGHLRSDIWLDWHAAMVSEAVAPLLAAALEGLTATQLARVAQHTHVTLAELISGFVTKDLNYVDEVPKGCEQPWVVLRRLLEALLLNDASALKHGDSASEASRAFESKRAECPLWALAACALGLPEIRMSSMLSGGLQWLAEPDRDIESPGRVTAEAKMIKALQPEQMLAHLVYTQSEDLKPAMIADFIHGSGVLGSTHWRNTSGHSNFWSQIICQIGNEHFAWELIKNPAVANAHVIEKVVRALDTELLFVAGGFEHENLSREVIGESIDGLIEVIEKAGAAHLLQEIDIQLIFAKASIAVWENLPNLITPEKRAAILIRAYPANSEVGKLLLPLSSPGGIDCIRLIDAQLKIPVEEMSMPQFMLWGFLHGLDALSGNRLQAEADKANAHLVHMAKAMVDLQIPGYEKSPRITDSYDRVHVSMGCLGESMRCFADYDLLANLPALERDILVYWGLDPKRLNAGSHRSIQSYLNKDLGL